MENDGGFFVIGKKMVGANEIDVVLGEAMNVMTGAKIEEPIHEKENAAPGPLFIGQVMTMLGKLIHREPSSLMKAGTGQVEDTGIGAVEVALAVQQMATPDLLLGPDARPPFAEVAARPIFCKAIRIWSADHASGRDVSQSPSNLG
jgi:hypothetical protein